MADTAQPMAAETDGIAEAAEAFKAFDNPPEVKPRDEKGRFVTSEPEPAPGTAEDDEEPAEAEAAEPEAEDEAEAVEADAEDEAEEEAQPEAVAMPSSWSKEDEQTWAALPVDAQHKIAERETQREQAVNRKFEEAANDRRAARSEAEAAQQSRAELIQAMDQVTSLLLPEEPPLSLLDANSSDYNPDYYHILKAQYDRSLQIAGSLHQQRQELAAQQEQEAKRTQQEHFAQINAAHEEALIREIPEIADNSKAPDIIRGLVDYAVGIGAPREMFQTPTTLLEWRILAKAKAYDQLQEAKGKAKAEPPPKPKAPAVKPGVTTPRSTIKRQQRNNDFKRLEETGSIADGARAFKHFMGDFK